MSLVTFPEEITVGEKFQMQCIVTPTIKDAQYTWFRENYSIVNNDTLVLEKVTNADIGSYTCVVKGIVPGNMAVVFEGKTENGQVVSEFEYYRMDL